ncbi:MAG: DUF1801 domain-containing protein [Saprospiraceae bacterium]|nr:DUF1801 domain-containing protein [Saprospiraceae bacterium]
MMTNKIDDYISAQPEEVRDLLELVRNLIRDEAPEASEDIKYGIPTFIQNGNLVHFAAFKHHIGLYPTPSGMTEFAEELSPYKAGKGSVQFPLDKPLPLELIRKIVRFRVQETQAKKTSGKKKSEKPPQ